MRLTQILLFFVAAGFARADQLQSILQKFIQFSARYGRSYASILHHNQSFDVFQENLRLIEKHNSKEEVDFKMGINPYSDLTMD